MFWLRNLKKQKQFSVTHIYLEACFFYSFSFGILHGVEIFWTSRVVWEMFIVGEWVSWLPVNKDLFPFLKLGQGAVKFGKISFDPSILGNFKWCKVPPTICSRRQFQILPLFSKITNKAWYFMQIVCWQTILVKYDTLFFFLKIRKDVAKFVICCSRDWRFKS